MRRQLRDFFQDFLCAAHYNGLMETNPGSMSFRDFARQLYARPGMESLCLELQDRWHTDVNLLLFACWYGVTRGRIDETLLSRAMLFSESWSDAITQRLREARRWMKKQPQATSDQEYQTLREDIKALELRAEFYQGDHLEKLSGQARTRRDYSAMDADIRSNLTSYARAAGFAPALTDPIVTLLSDSSLEISQHSGPASA